MQTVELQSYFRKQQVSLQWLPVLRALADELESRETPEVLRGLFSNVGQRLAHEASARFSGASTLADLEQCLNDFWTQINWGWVRLTETRGRIDIAHHAAPLAEAFGDASLEWSCGFLEGFYEATFAQSGSQTGMTVHWAGLSGEGFTLNFEFSR